jgi:lysophospholipid acyltransferase (LPLAT)-like uncharacterized protein
MFKAILKSPAVQTALGRVLGWYMLLVGWTTRWEFVDRRFAEEIWASSGPAVGCFWHRHIIQAHVGWRMSPFRSDRRRAMVMISRSKEGGVVAEATETVGASSIRGSSSKGALEATRQALRHMNGGGDAVLTPDGPRGPRMRMGLGAVALARQKGAPLIGFAWSIRHSHVAMSWDRQILPPPFSRGVYVWTRPFHISKDASAEEMEATRAAFEAEMIRISNEADRRAGVEIVGPDPAPAVSAGAARAPAAARR